MRNNGPGAQQARPISSLVLLRGQTKLIGLPLCLASGQPVLQGGDAPGAEGVDDLRPHGRHNASDRQCRDDPEHRSLIHGEFRRVDHGRPGSMRAGPGDCSGYWRSRDGECRACSGRGGARGWADIRVGDDATSLGDLRSPRQSASGRYPGLSSGGGPLSRREPQGAQRTLCRQTAEGLVEASLRGSEGLTGP